MEIYDQCRREWKSNITFRQYRRENERNHKIHTGKTRKEEGEKEIVSAMFVPGSTNLLLLQKIVEAEEAMAPDMQWKVKIVEQSGFPLGMYFAPKFPLLAGCPRGEGCNICGNTGVKCNKKGVIYKASCQWCKHGPSSVSNQNRLFLQEPRMDP